MCFMMLHPVRSRAGWNLGVVAFRAFELPADVDHGMGAAIGQAGPADPDSSPDDILARSRLQGGEARMRHGRIEGAGSTAARSPMGRRA